MPLITLSIAKNHWSDMFSAVLDGTSSMHELQKSAEIVRIMTGYAKPKRSSRLHSGTWHAVTLDKIHL